MPAVKAPHADLIPASPVNYNNQHWIIGSPVQLYAAVAQLLTGQGENGAAGSRGEHFKWRVLLRVAHDGKPRVGRQIVKALQILPVFEREQKSENSE